MEGRDLKELYSTNLWEKLFFNLIHAARSLARSLVEGFERMVIKIIEKLPVDLYYCILIAKWNTMKGYKASCTYISLYGDFTMAIFRTRVSLNLLFNYILHCGN